MKKKTTLVRKNKKTLNRSATDLKMIKQLLNGGGFGGMNLGGGMMSGGMGGGMLSGGMPKMSGGPGTHAPVQASGASVGKMADGRMIHLTGSKMGQMV